MKVSIIIPTYNDAVSITETLNSVVSQTYENIEIIIVDDGSTDNTKDVVKSFYDKRMKYYYQQNADQLNAVQNGFNQSTGDIIYILHSDDLFYDEYTIENAVKEMFIYECEALKGPLVTINANSEEKGIIPQRDFSNKRDVISRMFLLFGINILNDFAFIKRSAFIKYSQENYLKWNTPFWLNLVDGSFEVIKMDQSSQPLIKYRIHEENYINNKLGKYNVINGNLRTLMYLMDRYHIPFFYINRFISRILKDRYSPIMLNKSTKNKYKIVKSAIVNRVGDEYKENIYLVSIIQFYKKIQNKNVRNKSIKLKSDFTVNDIFYGKDMRKFNKMALSNQLPDIYYELFENMQSGFGEIIVEQSKASILKEILLFLNVYFDIRVIEND